MTISDVHAIIFTILLCYFMLLIWIFAVDSKVERILKICEAMNDAQ